jgi:hypothetical protein
VDVDDGRLWSEDWWEGGYIALGGYSIQELIKNELCLPLALSRIADQSTCPISIHA